MKVLIIEDESSLAKLLKLSLENEDCQVSIALDAKTGLSAFQSEVFDVVLTDIGLPDRDGLEVLSELKALHPEIPVVIMTAHGSVQSALTAMKRGAYDYIQKPFEPEEIRLVLERALREQKLKEENSRLRQQVSGSYDFGKIIGQSIALKKVFDRIRKAADTKSTVLILGESGTGKELLAKAIHFNSDRKDKAFVVVDCASIPSNLIESELFGHLKGAFTGADRAKKGLFEEADGGSIFLDEIGELPLELQSKLLRVLQESTIRRVGDTKPLAIDVRVIAATHRNLEEEVKTGKFRQDLFYRLNVVPLHSPSLRERREDIPLLAQYFLKRFSADYKRKINRIEVDVLLKLQEFDWPGNVRQLENLIEQMVVMSEGESIRLGDLPPPLVSNQKLATPTTKIPEDTWDLKKILHDVQAYTEECMIRKALDHTAGNKTKAAELLGISRRALIYKAQEYGFSTPEDVKEADLAADEA